jgi:mRNA deadenylase 3'-5' endonuclease subunit Ccr4
MLQRVVRAPVPRRSMSSFSIIPKIFRPSKETPAFYGYSPGMCFSVVQFNILASNLASEGHFPYVKPSSLAWENRRKTLINQLSLLNADVVCLEECSDYWTFFRPRMERLGYDSVYVKRPSTNTSTWYIYTCRM